MSGEFFKKMIRNLGTYYHDKYPHRYIEYSTKEIKIILCLTK